MIAYEKEELKRGKLNNSEEIRKIEAFYKKRSGLDKSRVYMVSYEPL